MKRSSSVLVLALVASVATAQTRPDSEPTYRLRVRAADTTLQAKMSIYWSARIFTSIGVVRGTIGSVSVGPGGGSGTGTVVVDLSNGPGTLTFTALSEPELELTVSRSDGAVVPRLVARGRVVLVTATANGEYSVGTRP